MKRKEYVILLYVVAILTGGCTKAPENVQEDIARQETEEQKVGDSEDVLEDGIELHPIREILASTPAKWKTQNGPLTFDGIVQIPDVEEFYKWDIDLADEHYQNAENTRNIFLKYFDNLTQKEQVLAEEGYYYDYIDYRDTDDIEEARTDSLTIDRDGGLALTMSTSYWTDEEEGNKWCIAPMNARMEYERNYLVNMDGNCIENGSDTCELYGGETISIQDAVDNFATFLADFHLCNTNIVAVPDRVSLFRNEEQNCDIMTIHGTYLLDGVRVDDSIFAEQPIRTYGNICRLQAYIEQYEFGVTDYPYATCVVAAYQGTEKLETYNEILSLEDAWSLLTGKAADEKQVEIQRADLMYSIWYQPEGDTNENWEMQMSKPPEMYATPVWRFVSYRNAQQSYVYYVDAITGEVTAYYHAALE